MIRVICIDGTPVHPMAIQLTEGIPLVAYQCEDWPDYYIILGFEFGKDGNPISHKKRRFIPLSDIDELQLVNAKEECV